MEQRRRGSLLGVRPKRRREAGPAKVDCGHMISTGLRKNRYNHASIGPLKFAGLMKVVLRLAGQMPSPALYPAQTGAWRRAAKTLAVRLKSRKKLPARLEFNSVGRTGPWDMKVSERQTAPPLEEVVLVTFRLCLRILEAVHRGSEILSSAPLAAARIFRPLKTKANVYLHLPTELVYPASNSRGSSSLMVAPA
jgi:hypothetical protein